MPNATESDQETLETIIAPFYRAVGKASARWQRVEAGLFILAHAIMQTDYQYSSIVFFHIRSADSKAPLALSNARTRARSRCAFSTAHWRGVSTPPFCG
jgi:hypothetical protein